MPNRKPGRLRYFSFRKYKILLFHPFDIKDPIGLSHEPTGLSLHLILYRTAVTTRFWIAPCNNGAIFQDRSKCTPRGVKLLHTLQLVLDCRAVTATDLARPTQQRSHFPGSKQMHHLRPEAASHSSADLGL